MHLRNKLKTILKSIYPINTTDFESLSEKGPEEAMSATSYVVHFLWVSGCLSELELLCIKSYAKNGFDVILWHYGPVDNCPSYIQMKDGREILEESRVFKCKNGSFAAFADLFRYKVLSLYGGIWSDTDVVCLVSCEKFKQVQRPFFVSEKINGITSVNNNLIFWPYPEKGDFVDLAFAFADRFNIEKLEWGDCGPKLLHSFVLNYPHMAPAVMEPLFCNSIPYDSCPAMLLDKECKLNPKAFFLHCYNETWRRAGRDKNLPFPKGSVLEQLNQKYS